MLYDFRRTELRTTKILLYHYSLCDGKAQWVFLKKYEKIMLKNGAGRIMMEKNAKIYVAGHRGMVGSAIVRELEKQGYQQLAARNKVLGGTVT